MKRIVTGLVVVALLFGVGIGTTISRPADAQDTTDTRLSALETQVAKNTSDISATRKRIKKLEDAAKPGVPASNPTEQTNRSGSSPASASVSGSGVMVSDKFDLAAGRYKVTAMVDVANFDGFAVYVYAPDGSRKLLFNDIIPNAGTWTSSTIYDAGASGSYYITTANTKSSWTLTFEPA